ncbi:MAG: hypothetical protein R3B36_21240 [Polyangiaceae bacterium]
MSSRGHVATTVGAAAAALLFVYSTYSLAQAPKAAPAPPASGSASAPPPPADARALSAIADAIGKDLGAAANGALVVASPLKSDAAAPRGAELSARIASLLAGKLGARAHPSAATLASARALSGRASSLVFASVEIVGGALRVTVDLYPVVGNSWDRLRNPLPGPKAHAFAQAPIDAEVRAFLAPTPLEQAKVHKASLAETDVLAVACGDLDQDGGLELAIVSRDRVALGKLRAGKFVPTKTATWASLAKRVPVPLREPIGGASLSPRDAPGLLLVGTSDRGGVALDGSLAVVRSLPGVPVATRGRSACAAPSAESSAFEGGLTACERSSATPRPLAIPGRFDAAASLELVGPTGETATVTASRDPVGSVRLVRGPATAGGASVEVTLDGAGAQLALDDLDDDGEPELITTADAGEDAITISTLTGGKLRTRRKLPAPAGVRAIGTCPAEQDGRRGVVAVVGAEVWLVR